MHFWKTFCYRYHEQQSIIFYQTNIKLSSNLLSSTILSSKPGNETHLVFTESKQQKHTQNSRTIATFKPNSQSRRLNPIGTTSPTNNPHNNIKLMSQISYPRYNYHLKGNVMLSNNKDQEGTDFMDSASFKS